MYSSNVGVVTVLGVLAGLVTLSVGAISGSWSEFAVTLVCWTVAAAVEIVVRGPRRWWDVWARALGVALVALAACGISFATVAVAGIGGLLGGALFAFGWIALMVRPVRRLVPRDQNFGGASRL